jgi:hypothetical protein
MTAALLRIPFQTEDFPAGTVSNGASELSVTWDDVLWAAVTVGRPNRHYVFRHGDASMYEAVFRWSLVRMALEQSSSWAYRLRRTNAAKTLDPTEKGAVNYFLGMTFCKLFASKLLNTPWLLHLDVFRPMLNPVLTGRSRPDLVGKKHRTNQWHAFECKGRISTPDSTVKRKAKDQAMRLVSVNGTSCCLHVGAITYFRSDMLNFYWRDPLSEERNRLEVPFNEDAWRYYYSPVVQMVTHADRRTELQSDANTVVAVRGLDLEVTIHRAVAKFLFRAEWDAAQRAAVEAASDIAQAGYQPDGLLVKAGETWRQPFEDSSNNKE